MYKGKELFYPQIKKILITNEEAAKYVGIANSSRITSDVFFGLGVLSVCFTAIISIDREDPKYFYRGMAVGGTLITISIPIRVGFTKGMRKAIDIYNGDLNLAYNQINLNFQTTSNGFGFVLKF